LTRPGTTISAVIFDLGNVLLDFDHSIAARGIKPYTNKTVEEIYQLFFDSGITGVFEEGLIGPRDFFLKVKGLLGVDISYEKFLPIWNEIFFFSDRNRQVYALAKALKAHYRIGLLSNINILHLDYIKNHFPILDIFDNVFASCQLKRKKPDHEIYLWALKEMDALPENAFYTDDRADLIEEARSLGINGFVFQSPEQLKKDLSSLGVRLE
jgi:putative hydrolase of the HAD superfamily